MIWGYGLWLSAWCIIGTVTGLTIINKLVEKTGRPSILVFILLGILILGAIATVIIDTFKIKNEIDSGRSIWLIQGVCK